MPITARLIKGAYTFDLTAAPYSLSEFDLPDVVTEFEYAGGLSANRLNGSSLVDTRYVNRETQFAVRILGTSEAQLAAAARRLITFVTQYDDPAEPLYLEYKGNTLPEPLWGQWGAAKRYEIVSATADVSREYSVDKLRASGYHVIINANTKPFAIGKKQRLAMANGAIIENRIETPDGIPNGVMAYYTYENRITNPVFGDGSTTGWSLASLIAEVNRNPAYLLPETNASVYLTSTSVDGIYVNKTTFSSVYTVTLSCYAKLANGGAVSSTHCILTYNGTERTTTFTAVGNGWYRLKATFSCSTTPLVNTGIKIRAKYALYVSGFSCIPIGFPLPLIHGDMLGAAWTGTAHASTTTVANPPQLKLPFAADVINRSEGTICMGVTFPHASTLATWNPRFFEFGNARMGWDDGTATFYFTDGTNTATSSAQTFTAGTRYVLHAVYSPTGMALYVNGAVNGTAAAYAPPTGSPGPDLYICGGSFPFTGLVHGFTTYERALTANEISADYTARAAVLAQGRRMDYIPYLWTKDGDNTFDTCDDSTHDNWGIANGIPGTKYALAEFEAAVDDFVIDDYLSINPSKTYYNPGLLYNDRSGTSDSDSSGGAYQSITIGTSPTTIGTVTITSRDMLANALIGRELYAIARVQDAIDPGLMSFQVTLAVGNSNYYSEVRTVDTNYIGLVGWGVTLSLPVLFPDLPTVAYEKILSSSVSVSLTLSAWRASGSAAMQVDYVDFLPSNVIHVYSGVSGGYLLRGTDGVVVGYTGQVNPLPVMESHPLTLNAGQYNHIVYNFGESTTIAMSKAVRMAVWPLWELI